MKRILSILPFIIFSLTLQAQQIFRNLTAEEVKIDSVLPRVNYSFPLSDNHSDSVYTLRLLYPEFLEMSASEVEAYKKICGDAMPGEMPEVGQYVSFARKRPVLTMSFCPVVFRDGRYQYLVSFLPEMKAEGA
ncbi:MAG: Por secretion system protein, partial [Prevotella sp.]|nr:Por secretion system protein [Prevotella sp.]